MLIERLNALLLDRAVPANAEEVAGAPTFLQLEVSNVCNLRCAMCPIETLDAAARKLKPAQLERILDQFPFLKKIDLYGIGEPLSNAALPDLVAACRRRDIATTVITNGMLLSGERLDRLLASGLDRLLVSIDSVDPERFNAIRVGGDFQRVIDNLKEALEKRARLGARKPEIGVVTILMEENRGELNGMIDLFNRLGIDSLIVKGLNTAYLDRAPSAESTEALRIAEQKARAIEAGGGMKSTFWLPERHGAGKCYWPWKHPFITAAGDVVPCCNCPDPARMRLGNLFEEGFARIWNGPAYRAFRASFRDGVPEICNGCPDFSFDYLKEPPPAVAEPGGPLSTLQLDPPTAEPRRGEALSFTLRDLEQGRFDDPVELWLLLRDPAGRLHYLLDRPDAPFTTQAQPFRRGIQRRGETLTLHWSGETTAQMGAGDYHLYACAYRQGQQLDPARPERGIASNLTQLRFSLRS